MESMSFQVTLSTLTRLPLQRDDPLTDGLEISPSVVLGINFVLLFVAIVAFSQAVRMYIHSVRNPRSHARHLTHSKSQNGINPCVP